MTSASSAPYGAYDSTYRQNGPLKVAAQGQHRAHNLRISQRTSLNQDTITLNGWPSRGGIIVLENASAVDIEYLGLDPLDPPLRRDAAQEAEDAFCQALLRLGATWWESESRRHFVRKLENGDEEAHDEVDADEMLEPTRLERGWVRVAWPASPAGSLCVLACEKLVRGRRGGEVLRPECYGLVSLARTMEERCTILLRLGGSMYSSIEEVQVPTFLRAWEQGYQGKGGLLVQYEFIDPNSYGGHPDDALGKFRALEAST